MHNSKQLASILCNAGGANGIGASIVHRLVNEGCTKVFVIDICPMEDRDCVIGFQVGDPY